MCLGDGESRLFFYFEFVRPSARMVFFLFCEGVVFGIDFAVYDGEDVVLLSGCLRCML